MRILPSHTPAKGLTVRLRVHFLFLSRTVLHNLIQILHFLELHAGLVEIDAEVGLAYLFFERTMTVPQTGLAGCAFGGRRASRLYFYLGLEYFTRDNLTEKRVAHGVLAEDTEVVRAGSVLRV
jgi:hypothetical protein